MKSNQMMVGCLLAVCLLLLGGNEDLVQICSLSLAASVGMALAVRDASTAVTVTKALPNGAATVVTDGIDLGHGSKGDFLARCELQIEAPALVVGDLANGDTMIYDVYHDTAADFGSEALLLDNVITQTGAGGAGAAAQTKQVRFPVDVNRYVRVKATNSGAGDASDKSLTARLVF